MIEVKGIDSTQSGNLISLPDEGHPYGISLTQRLVIPAAEKLLYVNQPTHNEGHITLVDYMGGDLTVERVATAGHMTKVFPGQPDLPDFLNHVAAKGIIPPFKSVQLKFHIQCSIADALHIVYAKPASVNEYSARYSVLVDSSFVPTVEYLLARMKGMNAPDAASRARRAADLIAETRRANYAAYAALVSPEIDVARELARAPVDLNNDTMLFWKIELDDLVEFLQQKRKLNGERHSLFPYLVAMVEAARAVAPYTTRALQDPGKELSLTLPGDEEIVDPTPLAAPWKPAPTSRVTVLELEQLLFVPQSYLDHGAVQAVDYLGDNRAPVESARISYGVGTKRLREDSHLVRYLFSHKHTTPFEHGELAVEGKVPLFVDPRQAGRHRTLDFHCFLGETRLGSEFFIPPAGELKYQDRKNRQGRGKELDDELKEQVHASMHGSYQREVELVAQLRELKVDEDTIRRVKGVGFYTFTWRIGDTHNWLHFLGLRLDAHAQKEIREYAEICARFISAQSPDALQSLYDYQLHALTLSAREIPAVASLLQDTAEEIERIEFYRLFGFTRMTKIEGSEEKKEILSREGEELQQKLRGLKEERK